MTEKAAPRGSVWESAAGVAIVAGLAAGLLDIPIAAAINQVGPALILKVIASGLIGASAYHVGASAVWLGLLLQIVMSVIIAALYGAAARRIAWLNRRWLLAGLAAGVVIFVVMNMVVVPLSAMTPRPHVTLLFVLLNLAAMLLYGVVIALVTARLFRARTARRG